MTNLQKLQRNIDSESDRQRNDNNDNNNNNNNNNDQTMSFPIIRTTAKTTTMAKPTTTTTTTIVTMLLLLFVAFLIPESQAAHSRRRIVVRRGGEPRYDRSITTFSPDGRLAQVEYAFEAAMRGSTIAAMQLPFHPHQHYQHQQGICIIVDSSSSNIGSTTTATTTAARNHHRHYNNNNNKVHRIDHHAWFITAGLSGDARLLAQSLRTSCQNHRLNYGEAPTIEQIARMAGQLQHQLTRTAGARPLGCSAFVIGIDDASLLPPLSSSSLSLSLSSTTATTATTATTTEKNVGDANGNVGDDNNNHNHNNHENNPSTNVPPLLAGIPKLFETDPGGIAEECQYAVAGKGRPALARKLAPLVSKLHEKAKSSFSNSSSGNNDNDTIPKNTKDISSSSSTSTTKSTIMEEAVIKFAELVWNHISESNNKKDTMTMVDIWIIRPNPERRGGMQATCHRNVVLSNHHHGHHGHGHGSYIDIKELRNQLRQY